MDPGDQMFFTKVEGYVYHGEYYDPITRKHRKGLVVPVRAILDESKIPLPPDGKSRASRLVVDELEMEMERRAENRKMMDQAVDRNKNLPDSGPLNEDCFVKNTAGNNNSVASNVLITSSLMA